MPERIPRHQPRVLAARGHQRATDQPQVPRESASRRGYGRRWRRRRLRYLAAHPWCADPSHRLPVPGEHVDHIVPLARGGTDDETNLQTLCASCHARKTVLLDGGFGRAPDGGEETS